MKKDEFIVKIQLPIGGEMSHALMYNEDRTIETLQPITQALLKMFGKTVKIFAYCTYDRRTKTLNILRKAPWQEW